MNISEVAHQLAMLYLESFEIQNIKARNKDHEYRLQDFAVSYEELFTHFKSHLKQEDYK